MGGGERGGVGGARGEPSTIWCESVSIGGRVVGCRGRISYMRGETVSVVLIVVVPSMRRGKVVVWVVRPWVLVRRG